MKLKSILYGVMVLAFAACGTSKQTALQNEQASMAFEQGNYTLALTEYEAIINKHKSKGKTADWSVYSKAGISALMLENNEKAKGYLEKIAYNDLVDEASISALALVYKKIDNLSKEIKTLEHYIEKFPNGSAKLDIASRLLATYVESEQWENGIVTYNSLSGNHQEKMANRVAYLRILTALDRDKEADECANKILTAEPNQPDATEYFAKKHYDRAEELYQIQMDAYEKNKTNKQYKILLSKLKLVTTDFKKSRDYFETLYDQSPNKEYATYLANIYARLSQKEKSEHYRKLSKQ